MLLCHARVNPNFELVGHAEIVDNGWAAFGASVAFLSPVNYWECVFYPAPASRLDRAPGMPLGGTAMVRCAAHNNKYGRLANVTRSEDFRVQVFEGSVATTVGAEIEQDNVPRIIQLDHDPPSGDMPFGLCVSRGPAAFVRPSATDSQRNVSRAGIDIEPPASSPTRSPIGVRFTGLKVRKMEKPPVAVRASPPK
jgi:hypothetical protein